MIKLSISEEMKDVCIKEEAYGHFRHTIPILQ
jgi:hypothetical protein